MKSISTRLLAIMLAITAVGMLLISIIGGVMNSNTIHEQSLGRASALTSLGSEKINTWLTEQKNYINAIAIDFSNIRMNGDEVFNTLISHQNNKPDIYCVYTGYADGTGIFGDEWDMDANTDWAATASTKYDTGWVIQDETWKANERDWYKAAAASPGEAVITDLYRDATTGEFVITIANTISRGGNIVGVVAADVFITTIGGILADCSIGEGSRAFLTDAKGGMIVPNEEKYAPYTENDEDKFYNIYEIENKAYANLRNTGGGVVSAKGDDGITRYYAGSETSNGWKVYTSIPVKTVNAPIYGMITMSVILFVGVMLIASVSIYFTIRGMIVRPIKDITEAANALAHGKNTELKGRYAGEIKALADSFNSMENFNEQQSEWLVKIADGDLSVDVRARSNDDRTGLAISHMLGNLNAMLVGINQNAGQVAMSSEQIAEGAKELAGSAAEQADVVEKLSDSINVIRDKTRKNSEVAREAANLSEAVRGKAESGSIQMNNMMKAVTEINDASVQIGKVNKVIDDIAFQTNILALNAAVEAARAGEHGKGFAVVAEEVRNLASKSAEAAKNSGELIENSVSKANLGLNIATLTSESLNEIVESINQSAKIIQKIAEDSDAQVGLISNLNDGIDRMTQIIQQNSAVAAENSAASEEMSGQSAQLKELVAGFKTK